MRSLPLVRHHATLWMPQNSSKPTANLLRFLGAGRSYNPNLVPGRDYLSPGILRCSLDPYLPHYKADTPVDAESAPCCRIRPSSTIYVKSALRHRKRGNNSVALMTEMSENRV